MKDNQWKEKLAKTASQMSDDEKEYIISTLSKIKRTKYLEYLIEIFQPSEQIANRIRKYYQIQIRPINQ